MENGGILLDKSRSLDKKNFLAKIHGYDCQYSIASTS